MHLVLFSHSPKSDVTLFPGSSHEDFTIEYSSSSEHGTVSEEASTDLCSKKYKSDDEAEHSSLKDVYLLTRSPCQGRRKVADWITGHTRHFTENTCYSDKVTQWLASLPPERQVKKRKREDVEEGGKSKRARCESGARHAAFPYSQAQKSSTCHKKKHRKHHDVKCNRLPGKKGKYHSSKYCESVPSKPIPSQKKRKYDSVWREKRRAHGNESGRDLTQSQNRARDRYSSLTNGKRRCDRSESGRDLPISQNRARDRYSIQTKGIRHCDRSESWRDLTKSQNRVGDRHSSQTNEKRHCDCIGSWRNLTKSSNCVGDRHNSLTNEKRHYDRTELWGVLTKSQTCVGDKHSLLTNEKGRCDRLESWRDLTKSQNRIGDRNSSLTNGKSGCDRSVHLHRKSPLDALYLPVEKRQAGYDVVYGQETLLCQNG